MIKNWDDFLNEYYSELNETRNWVRSLLEASDFLISNYKNTNIYDLDAQINAITCSCLQQWMIFISQFEEVCKRVEKFLNNKTAWNKHLFFINKNDNKLIKSMVQLGHDLKEKYGMWISFWNFTKHFDAKQMASFDPSMVSHKVNLYIFDKGSLDDFKKELSERIDLHNYLTLKLAYDQNKTFYFDKRLKDIIKKPEDFILYFKQIPIYKNTLTRYHTILGSVMGPLRYQEGLKYLEQNFSHNDCLEKLIKPEYHEFKKKIQLVKHDLEMLYVKMGLKDYGENKDKSTRGS